MRGCAARGGCSHPVVENAAPDADCVLHLDAGVDQVLAAPAQDRSDLLPRVARDLSQLLVEESLARY